MRIIGYLFALLMLLPFTSALTSAEGTIIFGTIFSLAVIVIFFLILSIISKNGPIKVFFMALALLTILASVGVGVSAMQEFFPDLSTITETYGNFYILLVTLTAGGLMALLVWLVVVAVKSFNSYRGKSEELYDDD